MTSFPVLVDDASDVIILEISVVSVTSMPTSKDSTSESTRSVPFTGRPTTTVVVVVEGPKLTWLLLWLLFFLLDKTSSSAILDGVDDLEVLDEASDEDVTDMESRSITDDIGIKCGAVGNIIRMRSICSSDFPMLRS